VPQATSSWYFSPLTNGEAHRTGSSFRRRYYPYYVCLSVVGNLLRDFLVFQNFSLNFLLLFRWPKSLPVLSYISCPTFIIFLYINSCILVSFLLPLLWYFYPLVLPRLSTRMLSIFVLN
jgi:hypothetical protein